MTHVLRKGFDAWSSGTPVDVYYADGYNHYRIYDVEVPAHLVVKRRPKSMVVPTVNAKARRRNRKLVRVLAEASGMEVKNESGN